MNKEKEKCVNIAFTSADAGMIVYALDYLISRYHNMIHANMDNLDAIKAFEGGMADVIRVRNMVSYAKIELEMIKNEA